MATKMIFVNLPVADLDRSTRFYEALGWKVNEDFTDEHAACVVIDENICVMLLTRAWYARLVRRPIADTATATCGVYALALASLESVDTMTDAALMAGGTEEINTEKRTAEAEVGMYGRSFIDPDGHQWEPFWMDAGG